MAIPKRPEPRDWQLANAQELQATDRDVLAMLRDAKRRVDDILRELPQGKQEIRRAQLEQSRARLLAEQADVFERLGDIVSARRARSASRAARLSAAGDAALLSMVGKGPQGQFLYDSALQTSQRAIDAAMARMRLSQLPLSQRIYRTGVWMGGRLNRLINETMASGLNAAEFARRARDWFNPNTPGGIRYAAMRLARTEINNAFHAMSAEKYATTPWITQVQWNLSKSHPKRDICNEVADGSPYTSDRVPARPHPQCMCYITPKSIDEDEFIENFLKGEYDDYLDAELEKNGWAEPEATPAQVAKRRDDPAYKKDYERGWKAGAGRNDLTRADKRGEPPAYYDGFSDRSIGEPKWSRADERDEIDAQRRQIEKPTTPSGKSPEPVEKPKQIIPRVDNPKRAVDRIQNHLADGLSVEEVVARESDLRPDFVRQNANSILKKFGVPGHVTRRSAEPTSRPTPDVRTVSPAPVPRNTGRRLPDTADTPLQRAMEARIEGPIVGVLAGAVKRVMQHQQSFVGTRIKRVKSVKQGKLPIGSKGTELGVTNVFTGDITFREDLGRSRTLDDQFRRAIVSGHNCAHDHEDLESVAAHEIGHALISRIAIDPAQTQLLINAIATAFGLPFKPERPNKGAYGLLVDEFVKDPANKAIIQNRLSRYAATNFNEFLAEAWTAYTMRDNPSPEIRAIGEAMQQIISQLPEERVTRR